MTTEMIKTENEKIQFLGECWEKLEGFFDGRGYAGRDIRAAFSKLYTMYRPELPSWLGGLYDPKIGGFYYSVSAKDNEPFLPDIESTNQAINLMVNTKMIPSPAVLPESMKKQIEGFAKSLLDPVDGYFYHPQWGKNIVDSRRGRDLNWALSLADKFEYKYDYPTANEILAAAARTHEVARALPEQFSSEAAFIRYLEGFDWENDSYYAGNTIVAQGGQIIAAGYAPLCAEFLNKYQNPDTGFWSEDIGMRGGVNGFLKISAFYRDAGIGIRMPEAAARSIISCMTSSELGSTVCHLYNAWCSMDNILVSLRASGEICDSELADRVQDQLIRSAPEALICARHKTEGFMKPDGAFSFMRDRSTHCSQEAPVSVEGVLESDVNASVLCTSGLVNSICRSLGCGEVKVPLYTEYDYGKFLSALK